MGKIKRYGNAVERYLSSERGQRFFNFAYSVGAAIVICGAMFKFLDVRGGNTLLCIGMGTEVLIFILSAFDRPARDYNWETVFPELDGEPVQTRERINAPASSQAAPTAPAIQRPDTSEIDDSAKALAEQMQEMSRNLSTINALLEQQLKSAAGQLDALENMNRGMRRAGDVYESVAERARRHGDESEKLTANIEKLNSVYTRMLDAMNANHQQ